MHLKTFTAGVLAAGSLSAVLSAPMGRVHTPRASSTAVVDAVVSKLPAAPQSQQATDWATETTYTTHTPCTSTMTHTLCSSSTTAAAEALNVPRQAVDWAATPTLDPQQATPVVKTAWLAPSAPVASPPPQFTPAPNTPVLAPSAPVATPSPPEATLTYTYEETHRPKPDDFGKPMIIVTLSVLGGVVLLVAIWAIWSWRRGGKPFACFGSCCGRNNRERKLRDVEEESVAMAGAARHYEHFPVGEEVEMVPVQQWPGRGRQGEHVPAPVVVEMELPRRPEEMVYKAPGQSVRPEAEWARGY